MNRRGDPRGKDQRLFWFLVTNYFADTVGILNRERQQKLQMVDEQTAGKKTTWKQDIEKSLGIDDGFVRAISNACVEYDMTREGSIAFLLRGFDCPMVDELMEEILS